MSGLVPVSSRLIGGASVQTVDARELHAFLGSETRFNDWISRRLDPALFLEGRDFVSFETTTQIGVAAGNRGVRRDYALTLDMAKHLAMLERSAKGH